MIRIPIGLIVCACVLVIASAAILPENLIIEEAESLNSTESRLIEKRNVLTDAWDGLKNYFSYFIRGWFRRSDDEESETAAKGQKTYFSIIEEICKVGEFLKGNDDSACKHLFFR